MKPFFKKDQILHLFHSLDKALGKAQIKGEIYLVGGAVMTLVYHARPSTKDLDGYFVPTDKIRKLAQHVGEEAGVGKDWLNDAVKGFFSEKGEYDPFLELDNLKVFVARPEYLLAMKCLSMRIGEEFHDEEDIRFLLRYLNIESYREALEVIKKYYPIKKFPQKTLYALEEILPSKKKK